MKNIVSNILGRNLIRNSAEAGLSGQEKTDSKEIENYLADVECAALSLIADNAASSAATRSRAAELRSIARGAAYRGTNNDLAAKFAVHGEPDVETSFNP
jgi:hypothetical protein